MANKAPHIGLSPASLPPAGERAVETVEKSIFKIFKK